MIFSVLIPVVQTDLALTLVRSIQDNTRPPDRIAVIDNSKEGLQLRGRNGSVIVFRPEVPWGFNQSLNYGRELLVGSDLVSILNDDIIINRNFFQVIADGFSRGPAEMGVLCPRTTCDKKDIPMVQEQAYSIPDVVRLRQREGWAFTIRYPLWKSVPNIPKKLVTFFGDDWLYYWTNSLLMGWFRVTNHFIFHYVGKSVRSTGLRRTMEQERRIFQEVLHEEIKADKGRSSAV